MRTVHLLAWCLFTFSALADDWRFPDSSDMAGSWQSFRSKHLQPFYTESDFDGDGTPDEAWIAFSTINDSWSLVVFMNQEKTEHVIFTSESMDPRAFGIDEVPIGEHPTACGKGYWECSSDEPDILKLENPGLRFFMIESASRIFYWDGDAGAFLEVWESD